MKEKVDGIEWEFEIDDGGNAIITRAPKSISGDVRLPAKLKGASVTIIDKHAFDGCRELKSLVMSDNVEKFLANIENCNALESITISAEMVELGWQLAVCKSLRTINVPKRNMAYKSVNGLLLSKGGETMLLAPRGIVSATIPRGVTKIGKDAFNGCTKLKSVKMPVGVITIDHCAFNGCSELESITIPNSVRYIEQYAFGGCRKLKTVTIPSRMEKISSDAFNGCTGLLEIAVAKGNRKYESINGLLLDKDYRTYTEVYGKYRSDYALIAAPGGLTNVTIPDGVTFIASSALARCSNLKSVTIPISVEVINDSAFSGCSSLENITIPDGVIDIGDCAFGPYTFEDCRKLKTVTIPASVKKVGRFPFWRRSIENAIFMPGVKVIRPIFEFCTLGSVTIPDSVTRINQVAFYGCKGLTSVTIPKKVKVIGDEAFSDCTDLKSVTLPATLKDKGIGRNAFPKGVKFNWVK